MCPLDDPVIREGEKRPEITVRHENGVLEIAHVPRRPENVFFLVWACGWTLLSAMMIVVEWGDPKAPFGSAWLLFVVGPVALVFALRGVFNTRRIRVANGELRLEDAPVPPRSRRVIPCALVREVVGRERDQDVVQNEINQIHELAVVLQDGQRVVLLPKVFDLYGAREAEQRLAEVLGVPVRAARPPVPPAGR